MSGWASLNFDPLCHGLENSNSPVTNPGDKERERLEPVQTAETQSRRKGVRRGIDAHGGYDEIVGRGGHDAGQKLLRIAVVQREPRALPHFWAN
jgi:hypothetical protein